MNVAIDINQVYFLAATIVGGVIVLAAGVALWAHRQNQQGVHDRSRLTHR